MALVRQHHILLVTLLVVAAAAGLTLFLHNASVTASRVSPAELERIARLAANRQEALADQTEQVLQILAALPAVRGADAGACNSLLQSLLTPGGRYLNFAVIQNDGNVFCSGLPVTTVRNVSDRSYFQRAMTSGEFAVGDYLVGKTTNKPSITFAYPIKDHAGTISRLVVASVDLAWLRDFSNVADLPPETQLVLTDNKGVVLVRYPNGPSGVVAPEINLSLVKIIDVQTGLGVLEMKGGSNETLYVVAVPVKLADQEGFVHVFVSIPKRNVDLANISAQVNEFLKHIPFVR
jgi:hypothetical protein